MTPDPPRQSAERTEGPRTKSRALLAETEDNLVVETPLDTEIRPRSTEPRLTETETHGEEDLRATA